MVISLLPTEQAKTEEGAETAEEKLKETHEEVKTKEAEETNEDLD